MSALVLDAAVLIAVDRGDRAVIRHLETARRNGIPLRTHPLVVAQAWRGEARQAHLARMLTSVKVHPLDDAEGRAAGELMGMAGSADPVDAALVVIANQGDTIISDDIDDMRRLVAASGRALRVAPAR